jgi:hypothetical protein
MDGGAEGSARLSACCSKREETVEKPRNEDDPLLRCNALCGILNTQLRSGLNILTEGERERMEERERVEERARG